MPTPAVTEVRVEAMETKRISLAMTVRISRNTVKRRKTTTKVIMSSRQAALKRWEGAGEGSDASSQHARGDTDSGERATVTDSKGKHCGRREVGHRGSRRHGLRPAGGGREPTGAVGEEAPRPYVVERSGPTATGRQLGGWARYRGGGAHMGGGLPTGRLLPTDSRSVVRKGSPLSTARWRRCGRPTANKGCRQEAEPRPATRKGGHCRREVVSPETPSRRSGRGRGHQRGWRRRPAAAD